MNNFEDENNQLRKENEELRNKNREISDKENEKTGIIKIIIFLGVASLAGYIQSFSTIAALVVGCAGFYLCFMR